jgi:hypothetical protein
MDKYKHHLLFDYFGDSEEIIVDDLFWFSVRYNDLWSHRDTVPESSKTIIPNGVTEIHLLKKDGKDRFIVKWNGKYHDFTEDLEWFLKKQSEGVTLRMLFGAIKENCDGFSVSLRLQDIPYNCGIFSLDDD